MMTTTTFNLKIFLTMMVVLTTAYPSCKEKNSIDKVDPMRCVLKELGEASDLTDAKTLPSNAFVHISGIANPRTIIWQDKQTHNRYYMTKIMGAGGRLLYMEQLQSSKDLKILSDFEGTLIRWQDLDKSESIPMAKAMLSEWNFQVDTENAYIVKGKTKPKGCSK